MSDVSRTVIETDNSTIELSSEVLQVKPLGINTAQLAAQSVTSAKIANGNVTTTQLGTGAVNTANINDGAVLSGKIGFKQVNAREKGDIVAGAVNVSSSAVTSTSYITISGSTINLSIAATGGHRPLLFVIGGSGGTNLSINPPSGESIYFQIYNSTTSTSIHESQWSSSTPLMFSSLATSGFSAGVTNSFVLRTKVSNGTGSHSAFSFQIIQL